MPDLRAARGALAGAGGLGRVLALPEDVRVRIEQENGTLAVYATVDELEILAATALEAIDIEGEAYGLLSGIELKVGVEP